MFKKFLLKIYSFWVYLFNGLHQADRLAFGTKEESLGSGTSHEKHDEKDCVWQDLLKGELTQRVIDLRYETAHADRESKRYSYVGGGLAQKKNKLFKYKGTYLDVEGYDVYIVQDNKLGDNGSYVLKFKYDFLCRFNLERYCKKIILHKNENDTILDIYVSQYRERYNNQHKFFISELNKIINGDRRSDLLDFNSVEFISFNAFGCDDGVTYSIGKKYFLGIYEFDGSYVLRFKCSIDDIDDFIDSVYNEESERKFKNKERREGVKIDSFDDELEKITTKEDNERFINKAKDIIDLSDDRG
jgi:hypothetical protein